MIAAAVRLGSFKTKQAAVHAALAEFVARRNPLRLLELRGQVGFDPMWDYKRMRGGRTITAAFAANTACRARVRIC